MTKTLKSEVSPVLATTRTRIPLKATSTWVPFYSRLVWVQLRTQVADDGTTVLQILVKYSVTRAFR